MATQRTATVYIKNNTSNNASILLYHQNSSNGTQSGSWNDVPPGQAVGPLTVQFETGSHTRTIWDYWSVLIHVQEGPQAGFYISSGGGGSDPMFFKECQLEHSDDGKTLTFSVSTTEFDIALHSGSCKNGMTSLGPYGITHVFVVMLENHSFDSMLAMSGIPGITAATTADSNSYNGTTYSVQDGAPLSMAFDPGHEFLDVVEQLGGQDATYPPYPPINNSGFAANFAGKIPGADDDPGADIGQIMACFDTPNQLPVLYQLASEFAVCDHWYSSLPGPTWPNRFFLHGASSSGLDDGPSRHQKTHWYLPTDGFQYVNGSIFDALTKQGIPSCFYHDSTGLPHFRSLYSDDPKNGSKLGSVPQVAALSGVTILDFQSLEDFASDLQVVYPAPIVGPGPSPTPYSYTFIEPHWGNIHNSSYAGGSSQHPMDDVYGGEHLLAAVYAAIRKSPYWNTSLLIITYDEHGGLYDSVAPGTDASTGLIAPATPPGDNPQYGYNVHGYDFSTYGVRVPAVIVSPLIPPNTVSQITYDHTSVLKTLEQLFGLNSLTQRDAAANSLLSLLSLPIPRTDCPETLNVPAPALKTTTTPMTAEELARSDAEPLPTYGNMVGALQILRKTEGELSGGTPLEIAAIEARFKSLQTRGDARAYVSEVMAKVEIARQQKKAAGPARGITKPAIPPT